jgi:hypothetical protein
VFLLKTAIVDESNGFVYPQVQHMGDHYGWDAPDSVLHVGLPAGAGRTPNLKAFHLDPATCYTDIVTQGYITTPGLLVSTRLEQLLRRFDTQAHRSWPADVVLHAEHRAYTWIEFTPPVEPQIDWAASVFEVKGEDGATKVVRFDSAARLAETARKLVDTFSGQLWPRQVGFLNEARPPDLFTLTLTSRVVLASDALAEPLMREGMTGFRLVPCSS